MLYNITCLRHNTTSVTKDNSFKVLLNKRVFIFQFTAATKIEGWLIETVFLFKYFILTYVINSKQNFSIPNFISFIKVLFFLFLNSTRMNTITEKNVKIWFFFNSPWKQNSKFRYVIFFIYFPNLEYWQFPADVLFY